jgi:hypothetical protein
VNPCLLIRLLHSGQGIGCGEADVKMHQSGKAFHTIQLVNGQDMDDCDIRGILG